MRPPTGEAAEVEKCALRPCRTQCERNGGFDTERNVVERQREQGTGSLPEKIYVCYPASSNV